MTIGLDAISICYSRAGAATIRTILADGCNQCKCWVNESAVFVRGERSVRWAEDWYTRRNSGAWDACTPPCVVQLYLQTPLSESSLLHDRTDGQHMNFMYGIRRHGRGDSVILDTGPLPW
jgi:hypothetical protein